MKTLESPTNAVMILDGREVINFAGSAYLGLSREPELLQAGIGALQRYGTRVHVTSEYGVATPAQVEVEGEAAEFFGTEAALYISAGYLLGLTVLTGLRERFDLVLLDEHAHYSLRDAAAASQAQVRTFAHHDARALEQALEGARRSGLRSVIAVDGMCSTFGSIPPLGEYARLADAHGALLFVDESHSFGTLGATGRGALEECGLRAGQVIRGGSLGKAFCAAGAVIVGRKNDVQPLRAAPCVRGSCWGLVPGASMAAASLRLVNARPQLNRMLKANIGRLKAGMSQIGIELASTASPLATFSAGTGQQMQELQARLLEEGVFVLHTRYVGTGTEGVIRCSVFADHTEAQIDRLIELLALHRTRSTPIEG